MATISAKRQDAYHSFAKQEQYSVNPYRWQRTSFVSDMFFKLLLLIAPIQSILLTPVQGTTPATILILMAPAILVSGNVRYIKVMTFVIGFVLLYGLGMALSLSGYLIDEPDLSSVVVIRDIYIYGWMRQSNLTQGLYLMIPAMFTYFTYKYYQESFLKFAFYGILALAFYGFYEFIYFAIYRENGDFLSNRNFGDLTAASAGAGDGEAGFATGSLLQISNLFGPGFMRLKSLVGEPSMYALTVTPFVVYAFARRWWLIFAILMLSLVLGSSSTAIIGLGVGMGYFFLRTHQSAAVYVLASVIIVALLYYTSIDVQDRLDALIFQKLDSGSGGQRITSFINHAAVAFDGNILRTLFGIGFGTVRSTDMLSNLLANVGVVGLLAYSAVLLAPILLLKRMGDTDAIVAALLSIFVMEMVAVAEYAYLPPWFMVALGYARIRQQRLALPAPTSSLS
jgi:hypothetical protein